MATRIEIRPYQPGDEQSVVALWQKVFCDDPPHHPPLETIQLKASMQPELFFVALREKAVVGTIMAGFDGHRGWIYRVAVDPRYQRQRIGSALVRHAEAALLALGCPKIKLQVRPTNEAVVKFYEKLGYSVEPLISMGKRAT